MFSLKNTKENGFTLIELLVVTSIVALLASVIFGTLDDARMRARNTQKEELVRQYMTALEQYRNEYPTYPQYATSSYSDANWACIGFTPADSDCTGGSYGASVNLNNDFAEFIPGPPKADFVMTFGPFDMTGIRYQCTDATCSNYEMHYFLEQTTECNVGTYQSFALGGNGRCDVIIE